MSHEAFLLPVIIWFTIVADIRYSISDVRILELINKRTLQFEGIFGMSDDIVGNFDVKLEDVLQKRRTLADIRTDNHHY